MTIHHRISSHAATLIVMFGAMVSARGETRQNRTPGEYVDCGQVEHRRIWRERTPTLTAPDGRHAAYAIVEARTTPGGESPCATTSRLFIRSASAGSFRLAYLKTASFGANGNGIRLIDWSADSRYLLVEIAMGQWGSDWGDWEILVYDTRSEYAQVPITYHLLECYFGHECDAYVRPLGFVKGGVAVEVRPSYDAEGLLEPTSCVKESARFVLNFFSGELAPLPAGIEIRHYGKQTLQPGK